MTNKWDKKTYRQMSFDYCQKCLDKWDEHRYVSKKHCCACHEKRTETKCPCTETTILKGQ